MGPEERMATGTLPDFSIGELLAQLEERRELAVSLAESMMQHRRELMHEVAAVKSNLSLLKVSLGILPVARDRQPTAPDRIAPEPVPARPVYPELNVLTRRELEVLKLIGEGAKTKEI